ncbi:hypothetical protein [Photobacterium sanguinicancri]|uniref:Uncharacterized protein n=1 Tax=Photobacterium sanguinicancri TaxID=875932 RepID=A0AAW7Y874_9GAMM|nr:hypothetical protein [Photobacterium sanguinicancri]MDO6542959.1 hypothetical protein [Photobacterium sanguinicancri]
MKHTIMVEATGNWKFYFDVTKQQARDILNASEDEVINLNGNDETLSINLEVMGHSKKKGTGMTFEELDASDVRKQLKKLLEKEK